MANVSHLSILAGAAALAAFATQSFAANLTVQSNLTMLPAAASGFTPVDLTGAPLGAGASFTVGSTTISFVGVTPANGLPEGVVMGAGHFAYAPPIVDMAGTPFAGEYLSTGYTVGTGPGGTNGYIQLQFSTSQLAIALLWGSVDSSNQVEFLSGGTVIGTVGGTQVTPTANGLQTFGGSYYTLINSDTPFDAIRLMSGQISFESAEFESNPNNFVPAPEPAALAVLASGLLGLALVRRRIG